MTLRPTRTAAPSTPFPPEARLHASLVAILLAASVTGCRPPQDHRGQTSRPAEPAAPLRVLVLDDPELAQAITREWQALTEHGAAVRHLSSQELLAVSSRRLGADAVVYPSGLLGELAERSLIQPIPAEDLDDPPFARREIFEIPRLREVSWGKAILAVPFGSPSWTLLYRPDVFQKLQCNPPETWAEYRLLAERLADRQSLGELAPPAGEPWSAAIEPLAPAWAGHVLLARAAAYARHPNQFSTLFEYRSMQPLIAGPPFARALQELLECAKYLPAEARSLTPADARREFLQGHCGMALTWPSRADEVPPAAKPIPVGFADLPGSAELFNFRNQQWELRDAEQDRRVTLVGISGRLGSVTRESRQPRAASALLRWLSGKLSAQVCAASKHTTLFRDTHLAAPQLWVNAQVDATAAEQYAQVVKEAQNRGAWLDAIRIPGRERYLAELDRAVHAALEGTASPGEALRAASDAWNKSTDSLGCERQQKAYMRSLGLEP